MANIGSKLYSGLAQVAEKGKKVRLETSGGDGEVVESGRGAVSVVVQALPTNEGTIVVGGENVVAKAGSHTTPEQKGIALTKSQNIAFDLNDSTQVWIDATVDKDGVAFTVLLA